MKARYDIVIVGSGVVGAITALAIAKHTSLRIAVIEAKQHGVSHDDRVSAISHASQRILMELGVWDVIQAKGVSPYTHMRVWDTKGKGVIEFDAAEVAAANLGYIIEDYNIRTSLIEQFTHFDNIDYLCPLQIIALNETSEGYALLSTDQYSIATKLLIAADGAESWLRQVRQIEVKTWDYHHMAIVATVHTSLLHQQTAWQCFLPSGPLAFLPLKNPHASSIVWSATHDYATHLMSLDEHDFRDELTKQFSHTLGDVTHVSKRQAFPLRMRHAKQYVQKGFALVGDAAHTIHPLIGQGVNLGLLDGATLAEVIAEASHKNRNFAALATLRRYERWRKGDTIAMLTIVELLKQLFGHPHTAVQWMRNKGLQFTNQLPWLKRCLMFYALGQRSDLPLIATRGEQTCF